MASVYGRHCQALWLQSGCSLCQPCQGGLKHAVWQRRLKLHRAGCTDETYEECVTGLVFGLPKAHWCYVQWVAAGCALCTALELFTTIYVLIFDVPL